MKKKVKAKPTSTLPSDFSVSAAPEKTTPIIDTPPVTGEPEPSTPPAVPEIKKDAELNIEKMQTQPEELPVEEKQGKILYLLGSILGFIILAGVITLSALYLKTPSQKTAVSEPSPTPEITSAPTVTIKNADITFEVLNGSGVSGAAAKAGKQIETLGYKVGSLGNADDTQTGTTIYIAESLLAQKDTLMANLKTEFPTVEYSGVLTGSSSLIRLVIGK